MGYYHDAISMCNGLRIFVDVNHINFIIIIMSTTFISECGHYPGFSIA